MTDEQYKYLISLPLVLHIPLLHTFVVHAGLLAADPTRNITSLRQPLSHAPDLHNSLERRYPFPHQVRVAAVHDKATRERLRVEQELAILSDVPQNRDPWTVLNIRGIVEGGGITK